MKILTLVGLVVLNGCATLTQEEQTLQTLERYGPRCGVTSLAATVNWPQDAIDRAVRCIKSARAQDQSNSFLENLSRGFGDAGYIMGGAPSYTPLPRRSPDAQCMIDCKPYMSGYCMHVCR